MKNTVKKILALVFVVAMVCSLAVPAFAADEEKISVTVTVVDFDGTANQKAEVTLTLKKANVEEAVKAYNAKVAESTSDALTVAVDYSSTTGKITKVAGKSASQTEGGNVFGTGYWAVALNGKLVSEDMSTVAVENGDIITVYWNDPTFGTKLAMVDDSAIAQGIVSLYYYDAEGNRQPLKGANISLMTVKKSDAYKAFGAYLKDLTNTVYPTTGDVSKNVDCEYYFTTDEKGQIWLAPQYLAITTEDTVYSIVNPMTNSGPSNNNLAVEDDEVVFVKKLKDVTEDDGYTKKEVAYYNVNTHRNIVDVEVIDATIEVEADLYNVAGATGDMTIVYVLVAAAAVVTLGAVVIMKKKAVKAN